MQGQVRLGRWQPFTAHERITPPERFDWAAESRVLGLTVRGYDRYEDGCGEMRWRVLRRVPVMSGRGPDVTRSAAGRLASEGVLVPTAFRSAAWRPGTTPDRARALWRIGDLAMDVEIHVRPDGELDEISMLRWGNPDRAPYGLYPFTVTVDEERRFSGISIPARFHAGWWDGDRHPGGEFFRAQITAATFS